MVKGARFLSLFIFISIWGIFIFIYLFFVCLILRKVKQVWAGVTWFHLTMGFLGMHPIIIAREDEKKCLVLETDVTSLRKRKTK